MFSLEVHLHPPLSRLTYAKAQVKTLDVHSEVISCVSEHNLKSLMMDGASTSDSEDVWRGE